MAKYALIRGGEVSEIRDIERPEDVAHKVDKRGDGGPFARPVIDPGKPAFNSLIEKISQETVVKPKTVEVAYKVTPLDLATVKADLVRFIDKAAEAERLKHITPGAGQALEYAYVVAEARAIQADAKAACPLLQASVDAGEAKTVSEVAALVLAKNDVWHAIGADIRKRRLAAKRGIEAAGDVYAAYEAYSASGWGK